MNPSKGEGLWLRLVPAVVFIILVVPTACGLLGVFLPAFGYFPALGGREFTLQHWRLLLEAPGLFRSVILTIWIGLASTVLSLATVVLLFAQFHDTRVFWLVRRTLSPLLSIPHVAIAIGLALVIATSGLLFRFVAQFLPDLDVPPDLLIVHDRMGLSLIGALVLKEAPFLFLMSLAALPQINPTQSLATARTIGYTPTIAWIKVVLPRLYRQIRLPVLAVLAYSLSVVDAALIVGPTTPPPLGVAVFKWMSEPELRDRFIAAAGAVLVLCITLFGTTLWIGLERLLILLGRRWLELGSRKQGAKAISIAAYAVGILLLTFILLSAGAILLWAFAGNWPYPNVTPDFLTAATWNTNSRQFLWPLFNALIIGGAASLLALAFTVSLLERDVHRRTNTQDWMRNLLYVPLIVPQIAFLPGMQILLIALHLDSNIYSVIAAHLVFVLPYVYLSLSDPWAHFDDRYRQTAMAMGATPRRALFRVRLPMLLAALLTAAAVGFAVSVGQYLPTLLVGAGRVPTVTTEAVALASGGDRRLVAVLAMLQSLLPLGAFLVAVFVPLIVFRNRRGVRTT
jgi:putative thiamine transport system permease protein